MRDQLQRFLKHLTDTNQPAHTLKRYEREVDGFLRWLESQEIATWDQVDQDVLNRFMGLRADAFHENVVREIAIALWAFGRFLVEAGDLTDNPFLLARVPKRPKKRLADWGPEVETTRIIE